MDNATDSQGEKRYDPRTPYRFTKENAKEMQSRGVMKRMLFQTAEHRRYVAKKAAMRRWYKQTETDVERVEQLLRFFANQVVEFLLEEDRKAAVSTASMMLGWERLKISLRSGNMKDVTPEISKELEEKLAAVARKREMNLIGESRIVDDPDKTA